MTPYPCYNLLAFNKYLLVYIFCKTRILKCSDEKLKYYIFTLDSHKIIREFSKGSFKHYQAKILCDICFKISEWNLI